MQCAPPIHSRTVAVEEVGLLIHVVAGPTEPALFENLYNWSKLHWNNYCAKKGVLYTPPSFLMDSNRL